MANPRRQVLVDLSQIQQAHACHAPVLPAGWVAARSWAKAWLAASSLSGKSQMEDLPLTLAGHDLWRLVNQGGQDGAPLGFGDPFAFTNTRSFSIELIPTTSTCAARVQTLPT